MLRTTCSRETLSLKDNFCSPKPPQTLYKSSWEKQKAKGFELRLDSLTFLTAKAKRDLASEVSSPVTGVGRRVLLLSVGVGSLSPQISGLIPCLAHRKQRQVWMLCWEMRVESSPRAVMIVLRIVPPVCICLPVSVSTPALPSGPHSTLSADSTPSSAPSPALEPHSQPQLCLGCSVTF